IITTHHSTAHCTTSYRHTCSDRNLKVHLDTSRSAFANSIGHSSTGRVNHGHEANKAKVVCLEVDIICVKGKPLRVLVLWKHQVAETWEQQKCVL
uniref:Uncharacterized protein n=1 Tax=Seriola lalandi dorsalis TaxID=1841481 RepID=A0A3B4YTE2_SERLL